MEVPECEKRFTAQVLTLYCTHNVQGRNSSPLRPTAELYRKTLCLQYTSVKPIITIIIIVTVVYH